MECLTTAKPAHRLGAKPKYEPLKYAEALLLNYKTSTSQGGRLFRLDPSPKGRAIAVFQRRPLRHLPHLLHHPLGIDTIALRRIVNKHMRHHADQLSVLKDRTAAHECVKYGTTLF